MHFGVLVSSEKPVTRAPQAASGWRAQALRWWKIVLRRLHLSA